MLKKKFLKTFYGIDSNFSKLFAIRVFGNSMEPIIHSENFVIAEKTKKITTGEICIAALSSDEVVVRRYENLPSPSLIAENSMYNPIKESDNFEIIGKVKGIIVRKKP